MEATLLGKDIVSWILDLSYNGRWLQSNNKVFFLFQGTLLCNGSSVGSHRMFQLGWSGEISDNYAATICVCCNYLFLLQLSMCTATMEEEIVGVSVRLYHAIRQQFPKHRHS